MRKSSDTVLIVCEGSKTEPIYFRSIIRELRLEATSIHIVGEECGTCPLAIVSFGLEKSKKNPFEYDKIFFVFDRDSHKKYDDAMTKLKGQKEYGTKFFAINSIPSFEVWLIFHFECSSKPYQKSKGKSVGDMVESKLKKLYPNFNKSSDSIFLDLKEKTNTAIQNAKQIEKNHEKTGGDPNPSTKVYLLVEYLLSQSKQVI